MLQLSIKQKKSFNEVGQTTFKQKCFKHIKSIWTEEFIDHGEREVHASIEKAIEKSKVYGIKKESDILRYLDLMYAISFNFDQGREFEWIPEILTKLAWDPTVRLDLILQKYKRFLKGQDGK